MDKAVQEILERGIQNQLEGNFPEAERLYKSVLAQDPGNKIAGFLLAQVEGSLQAVQEGSPAVTYMLNAFRQFQTPYWGQLPYNLNWMLYKIDPIKEFLTANPIVMADIGASGGSPAELIGLKKYISYYAFDADPEANTQLVNTPVGEYAKHKNFPYYIGKDNGSVSFNLYKTRTHSSRLEPNATFVKNFGTLSEVESTIMVQGATLDKVLQDERAAYPEFIKLDTQGTELEVLQASPESLKNVLLIETEVEFAEMYERQNLFYDMGSFLHKEGFQLLNLTRVFHNRQGYGGEARGQMVHGDALFGRIETNLQDFTPKQIAKYAILLINYGHLDIAKEIFTANPRVAALVPRLIEYFKPYKSDEARVAAMHQDKILCWQLFKRKTNQIDWEGDNSWPIR